MLIANGWYFGVMNPSRPGKQIAHYWRDERYRTHCGRLREVSLDTPDPDNDAHYCKRCMNLPEAYRARNAERSQTRNPTQ